MQRYKITIEYDGTDYCGWQRQDALSIQECVEKAIYAFSGEEVLVTACGRTDAGVHAYGQVAHFDLEKPHPTHTVVGAINYHLRPHKIVITKAELVDQEFHARFSAQKRYYRYLIVNRQSPPALDAKRCWFVRAKLDLEKMRMAAQYLIGTHDFTSFRAAQCQAASPVKTLDFIEISNFENTIIFDFAARSFLHHMVRNIVGTLKMVGEGRISPDEVAQMIEAKDRSSAGMTAPAHGLYFMRVEYGT